MYKERKGRGRRIAGRIAKYAGLTAMAVVLFAIGILMAALSILTPERLTPLAEHVATRALQNARVEIDTVRLSMRYSFPYLTLNVAGLSVISTPVHGLDARAHANVPMWADTVFAVNRLTGGVNVAKLAVNTLDISDVVLDTPRVNLVVVNDTLTNFDIVAPTPPDEPPFDWRSLPELQLHRMAIEHPQPMRYLDVSTGTAFDINLRKASVHGHQAPLYKLEFAGNVTSPQFMHYLTLPDMAFGLDGDIDWNQHEPMCLGIKDMSFRVAMVSGKLSTRVNLTNSLVVESMDLALNPISVNEVLKALPRPFLHEYGIPEGIVTTATVEMAVRLLEPFNAASPALPHFTFDLRIPDSQFSWQKVKFDNMALDMTVTLASNNPDDAVVDIRRLNLRGPATDLTLDGRLTSLLSDPLFDGSLKGTCDLAKLPPILAAAIPGTVSGRLTADASIKGRPSMLMPATFHRLKITGAITLDDLYWLSADSALTVLSDHAKFDFGTNERFKTAEGHSADSLLTASIAVENAEITHSDIQMTLNDLRLGLGAVNRHRARGDSTTIVPLGGRLHVGAFNLLALGDSAMLRLRQVDGSATVRPFEGDVKRPEFLFDLALGHFSTGDRSTRMLFSDAQLALAAHPQPQGRRARQIAAVADSLQRANPSMPRDTVYAHALAHYNAQHHKYPRIHPEMEDDSTEILDWGTSSGLRKLLLGWRLDGEISAQRAGLYTPYFPLRNRLRNVNLAFNNDSLVMRDVEYKVGQSDFTASGAISNIRKAFTSRGFKQPLRARFILTSDTINVNQLADAVFTGSAMHQAADAGQSMSLGTADNDEDLDRIIGEHVQGAPDSLAPFLVPTNLDVDLRVNARNVLYSDLLLHDLQGKLLAYEGAISLHDLAATSQVGSLGMSALYMGRDVDDLKFGFGLKVNNFDIAGFLRLVPAVDSIMPVLSDLSGFISADVAATSDITRQMDLDLPTLDAAINITGDSLVLIDPETFKSMSKWLMFRNKDRNIIDHLSVQMLVSKNQMQVYPFIFDIDRYKLGVQGSNDLALNFNYHVAVLKSPLPFKFGINISGNPDKYKIRLGRAKFNEKTPLTVPLVDTTRINLVRSLENVFRRGVNRARFAGIRVATDNPAAQINLNADTLTHLDSLQFIQEGLIPAPDSTMTSVNTNKSGKRKSTKSKKNKKDKKGAPTAAIALLAVLPTIKKTQDDD